MNARLYDPVLGRILQSNTMIPDTRDPLAYNRYIYVKNNPLKYTDPTGHFGMIVAGFVLLTISATTDDPDVAMVTGIAGMALIGYGLGPAGMGLTAWQSGAIVGGTNAAIQSGGDTEAIARGAAAGALMGGVSDYYGDSYTLGRVGASTVAGGTASTIMGGNFEDGATFAFTTSSMAYLYNKTSTQISQETDQPYNKEGKPHLWADEHNDVGRQLTPDEIEKIQNDSMKAPWQTDESNFMKTAGKGPFMDAMGEGHDPMMDAYKRFWGKDSVFIKNPILYEPINIGTMPFAYAMTVVAYMDMYSSYFILQANGDMSSHNKNMKTGLRDSIRWNFL